MSTETFLFALDVAPNTARKTHIRRLHDILQLSIQRGDRPRALRAWSILARCKEFPWKALWTTGALLLGEDSRDRGFASAGMRTVEYLHALRRQNLEDREHVITELVLMLISTGSYREALSELDLYLPMFPYQDNPALHMYAGLLCLHFAQMLDPPDEKVHNASGAHFDSIRLREALSHFERAHNTDPDNPVATAFIEKINDMLHDTDNPATGTPKDEHSDGEFESPSPDQRTKRIKT